MGNSCSAEEQAVMALAAESDAVSPPTSSGAACDALLAKLDELMDFLRFAKLPTADFHGVVRLVLPAVIRRLALWCRNDCVWMDD